MRLQRTADQGFFMSGAVLPAPSGPPYLTDPLALRLDPAGNLLWDWMGLHPDSYTDGGALITSTGDFLVYGGSDATGLNTQQNRLARLDPFGNVYAHLLTGRVALDQNQNCQAEAGEPALSGWIIKAVAGPTYFAVTDSSGQYRFQFNADTAEIKLQLPGALWQACPPAATVTFQPGFDTASLDLMAQPLQLCPQLTLSAATPFLRRCQSNTYSIQVCNTGTVPAENIALEVAPDSFFVFENATWPLLSQNGNVLTFLLGELPINACTTLQLQVKVDCAAA